MPVGRGPVGQASIAWLKGVPSASHSWRNARSGFASTSRASITGGATDTLVAIANGIVNQQAAMIAYLNDFKLMTVLTACALPLVLVLKRPRAAAPVKADADAMGH